MPVKRNAYERQRCLVCGEPLEHKATGRPRRFCSDACKQKDYREMRLWAKAAVDADLLGIEAPAMWWRYETSAAGRTGSGAASGGALRNSTDQTEATRG